MEGCPDVEIAPVDDLVETVVKRVVRGVERSYSADSDGVSVGEGKNSLATECTSKIAKTFAESGGGTCNS